MSQIWFRNFDLKKFIFDFYEKFRFLRKLRLLCKFRFLRKLPLLRKLQVLRKLRLVWKFRFLRKLRFLPNFGYYQSCCFDHEHFNKVSILPKFHFLRKISILTNLSVLPNLRFLAKLRFYWNLYFNEQNKYMIFDQNFDFWPKFRFLTKISIFDEKYNQIFWTLICTISGSNR